MTWITQKHEVAKETVYGKLVLKVNRIDASGFALKTKYDTEKSIREKIMTQTKKCLILVDCWYNAKITEMEGKILSISGLATSAASTVVENKIPNVSSSVKKQIMTQKYQTLSLNILLRLIITSLLVKHFQKKKSSLINLLLLYS